MNDPDSGVISVLRFADRDGWFKFRKAFMARDEDSKSGLSLGLFQPDDGEQPEDVLVLDYLSRPEIHFHGGRANAARIRAALKNLGDSEPGTVSPRELLEMELSRCSSSKVCEYLTNLAHGRAELYQNGKIEGYEWACPVRVVLTGAPNTGKSSLFNRLCGEARVLVSDRAGTTRDAVSASLSLEGFEVLLTDTAGLDANPESDSIKQAKALAEQLVQEADLVLDLGGAAYRTAGRVLKISPRCDLGHFHREAELSVSAKTGEGVDELIERICHRVIEMKSPGPTARFHLALPKNFKGLN